MKVNFKNALMLSSMLIGSATATYGYKNNDKITENIDTLKPIISDNDSKTAYFKQFRNLFNSDVMIKKSGKLTSSNEAVNNISNKEQYDIYDAARTNLANNFNKLYINSSMYDYRQIQNYQNEYIKQQFKSIEDKHDNVIKLHYLTLNCLTDTKDNFSSFMQDIIEQVKVFNEEEAVYDIYDDMRSIKSRTKKLYEQYKNDINNIYNDKSLACSKFSEYSKHYDNNRLSQFLENQIIKLSYLINVGSGTNDMKDALVSLRKYKDIVLSEEENYNNYILNTNNSSPVYNMYSEQMDKFMNIISTLKKIPALKDNNDYLSSLNAINFIVGSIKSIADSLVEISDQQNAKEQDFTNNLYNNVHQFGIDIQSMITILDEKLAEIKNIIDTEEPTDPDQPANPDEPAEPDSPTEPDQPANPDEPAEPDSPTDPDQPANPDEPAEPDSPTDPDQPANPDEPAEPDSPTEPDGTVAVKNVTTSQPNIKHFDINGREINPSKPGIHILSNGKKVIVK